MGIGIQIEAAILIITFLPLLENVVFRGINNTIHTYLHLPRDSLTIDHMNAWEWI